MAYQDINGLADGASIVNSICVFLAGQGWTVDRNMASGQLATVHKPGVTDYIHFEARSYGFAVRGSVGYNSAGGFNDQPDSSSETQCNPGIGPFSKTWFFYDNNELAVVIASSFSGQYRLLVLGRLQKFGVYNGGTYCDATFWDQTDYPGYYYLGSKHIPFGRIGQSQNTTGAFRADYDGLTNNWLRFSTYGSPTGEPGALTEVGQDIGSGESLGKLTARADANIFSGRSFFHPITVSARRSSGYYDPVGYAGIVRACSLAKFDPEQVVSVADEQYQVFPQVRKYPTSTANTGVPAASGDFGWAIKKTV